MYNGDFFGEDEVRIMLFRLSIATMELKEKIRQYIIDAQYEIDEDDFLKLLDMKDTEEAYRYYDYLDTAAREHFFLILDRFDKELTSNMFAKLLTNTELLYIRAACKDELTNLEDVKNKVENFNSITKPIDARVEGYKNIIDILSKSLDIKE